MKQILAAIIVTLPFAAISLLPKSASANPRPSYYNSPAVRPPVRPPVVVRPPVFAPRRVWVPQRWVAGRWERTVRGRRWVAGYWVQGYYRNL